MGILTNFEVDLMGSHSESIAQSLANLRRQYEQEFRGQVLQREIQKQRAAGEKCPDTEVTQDVR